MKRGVTQGSLNCMALLPTRDPVETITLPSVFLRLKYFQPGLNLLSLKNLKNLKNKVYFIILLSNYNDNLIFIKHVFSWQSTNIKKSNDTLWRISLLGLS